MPKSPAWVLSSAYSPYLFGFAMVWYIWWLTVGSALGMLITLIVRAADDTEYRLSAAKVERIEEERFRQIASTIT